MEADKWFVLILIGFMLVMSIGPFTDQVVANAQSANATVVDKIVEMVFAPVYSGLVLGYLGVVAYALYKEVS